MEQSRICLTCQSSMPVDMLLVLLVLLGHVDIRVESVKFMESSEVIGNPSISLFLIDEAAILSILSIDWLQRSRSQPAALSFYTADLHHLNTQQKPSL
ncbi:hypothetical protein L1987_85232 [Smallanthus sonchifolius]|uniref:Uncharacterized protein n=1 Tax=Smallanthus sonchifolius TaxID=185202 RepID=A0ACB8XX54_9ASTR|nr:hypothetical protein L1987_85232 [Smallanthus sonchifolius]